MTQLCQSNFQHSVSSGFVLNQVGDFKGALLSRTFSKENRSNCCYVIELLTQGYQTCNCFYYKYIRIHTSFHLFKFDSCRYNVGTMDIFFFFF